MKQQLTGAPLAEALVGIDSALTLGGFLTDVCHRHAPREALVWDDPTSGETVRWSYADLLREATGVAKALMADGVTRGARVGLLMANRPEAVSAFFGAAMAGAVVVPLSTFSTRAELAQLLDLSGIGVLLAQRRMGGRDFAADLEPILAAPGCLVHRLVMLGDADRSEWGMGWDAFLASGGGIAQEQVDASVTGTAASDEGLVIFSSGTTSSPKGMLHTHRAPTLQFWVQARLFGRTTETRMWTALPLFWTAGLNTAMGATLAAGGCWVMQEGFDAGIALQLMARERVTEPYTLPHQARTLAEHPDWETADLSSLQAVFGRSVFSRHPSVTGDPAWQAPVGWGMSETCAFICAHPSDSSREVLKRSLGVLLPGNELRVVDPATGHDVDAGADGEFLVRGPTLMLRYLGKQREDCFDADGWLRTGDVGHIDSVGEVHWTGRRTEMIKTGGANVSPAEVEVAMRACPEVRLARVLGLPDERLEQIVCLCVELADGADVDAAYLRGFLRDRLASYKVPKRVEFFAAGEIPLTASGTKVLDDSLRSLVLARSAKEGATL